MTDLLPTTPCWFCHELLDAHDDPLDPVSRPSDGDVSVCLYCGSASMFVATPNGLTTRKPTEDEMARINSDPLVVDYMLATREVWERRH